MIFEGDNRRDNRVERAAAVAQDLRARAHRREHRAASLGPFDPRTGHPCAAMSN
jgi:hypothetical protein